MLQWDAEIQNGRMQRELGERNNNHVSSQTSVDTFISCSACYLKDIYDPACLNFLALWQIMQFSFKIAVISNILISTSANVMV